MQMDVAEFCERYAVERKGTNSLKWDALDVRFGDPDLIAAWVADMEFKAPEAVLDALHERIAHGVFGYSFVPDSFYEAFIDWEKRHHGYEVKKEWLRFSTGVVTALYWFVNAFTKPDESVLLLTPVYYPFHNAVKDTGRKLVTCGLVNENGIYHIDFDAFEKSIVDNDVKLFIQCSPHNPVGRVWTEVELTTVLSICKKHGVLVVSDEIHQDLVMEGHKHIPSAIIKDGEFADRLITVTAPSKTFNLAGLLTSHIMIENEQLRTQFDNYVKTVNQTEVNILGLTAAEAAYRHGQEWLDGLLGVIKHNYEHVKQHLQEKAPEIIISPLEGTYLIWLDMRNVIEEGKTKEFIQDRCRIAVDFGEWFGLEGKGFIRLNMATEPRFVELAVENILSNLRK
jgi:cystathionine beta-lyase